MTRRESEPDRLIAARPPRGAGAGRTGAALMVATLVIAAAALSGCGKAPDPPVSKAAGAQILPGTINDAMLNTDRSQSQAPLQPFIPADRTAPADGVIAAPVTGSDAAVDTGSVDSAGAPPPDIGAKAPAVKPPATTR